MRTTMTTAASAIARRFLAASLLVCACKSTSDEAPSIDAAPPPVDAGTADADAGDDAAVDPPFLGARIEIVSGDHQSVRRVGLDPPGGRAHFAPLVVRLFDDDNVPRSGALVQFTCVRTHWMACQTTPSGFDRAIVETDATGIARLANIEGGSLFTYYASERFTVEVTYGEVRNAFHLETRDRIVPPPPPADSVLTIHGGDHQFIHRVNTTHYPGCFVFEPLQVRLTRPTGEPLSGFEISWSCPPPYRSRPCMIDGSGTEPAFSVTDANGVATLARMAGSKSVYLYGNDATFPVTATDRVHTVSFSLTGGP